jgi:DUF1009 family protein
LGIIAGSGEFPALLLGEAQGLGYSCVIAGIRGEARPGLKKRVGAFKWVGVGAISDLVSFFKENGVHEAVFAGKVEHRAIFKKEGFDEASLLLLAQNKEGSPAAVIKRVIDFLREKGIEIKDPAPFLASFFCREGILTETKLSPEIEEDIGFGWKVAKDIARMDIGQTVVVKDKTVVAVEGMEGTDEAIKRGGHLAGAETVVVKVSRPFQDARVDLPAVGLKTIKSLVEAKARALCFEAEKMPFFEREKAVLLADAKGISIVAKKS